jgi:multidrug efflux pump subunit AcrB
MAHKSDEEIIQSTHNTARFFVENRQIAWVLLIGTIASGVFGYLNMPKRKDPDIPVRVATVVTPWPGATAEQVEQLVTRKIEGQVAHNDTVDKLTTTSLPGLSIVKIELDQATADTAKQFDDISIKLNSITDLPQGAGPMRYNKDYGDTAALMLTVASPKVSADEIAGRAQAVQQAIRRVRADAEGVRYSVFGVRYSDRTPNTEHRTPKPQDRYTIVFCLPQSVSPELVRPPLDLFARFLREKRCASDVRPIIEPGLAGLDVASSVGETRLHAYAQEFVQEPLQSIGFVPDAWQPVVIRDPREAEARLAAVAGDKYTYRQLDDFTDLIDRSLRTVPQVSKIDRAGVLDQKIYLVYSQERLASYGLQPADLQKVLGARNIVLPGGELDIQGKKLDLNPSGLFKSEKEIGNVLVSASPNGSPVYLRDLVDIVRDYDNPPRYLNFYTWRDARSRWQRSRAITLGVQMRSGRQIGVFSDNVNAKLAQIRPLLPADLVLARTSDQPQQVKDKVDLFMKSLYEAIVLVVLVSLIGFRDWRSALLMALSIPITLAMTFGMMLVLGIDVQQVSLATLIIALGLLVDNPVVAGDAIKRGMGSGHRPLIAAWLGPTKLATALTFATITNIVAYLPFLMLTGDTGRFLHSLPIVMTCSLIASLLVSRTFIPLISYYLLRPHLEPPIEEVRQHGFPALYYRVVGAAIDHRWRVLAGSLVFLALGGVIGHQLKSQFFPKDLSYLSYLDVWLPPNAPLTATNETVQRAEQTIRQAAEQYGREHPEKGGKPKDVLQSVTSFIGGGGPRFWYSVSPELPQLNYSQVLVQVKDDHDTQHFVGPLQEALSASVPGARVDVRQLATGKPIDIPIEIRLSGEDIPVLRDLSRQVQAIFRAVPVAWRVRDDWDEPSFRVNLQTDPDRANLAGITNLDVAASSAAGMNGIPVTTLQEGRQQIPVVARLRWNERAELADLRNLYVYSSQGEQKVPLRQVSSVDYQIKTQKIKRRNQFRTVTISCFPATGHLPSEVMEAARPQLTAFERRLPPGYWLQVGGDEEEQVKGFKELVVVLLISVALIYIALVFQFRHAIKPVIVFAAIPYGAVGGLAALWYMGQPFGFMGFLGVISLVGVIVSHIIVLFDFIEEAHERGEPLRQALLDAGIMRLRPVMITVLATVTALFPLAMHGGPLWEPLCYAQIGGLSVATFITLGLVPIFYSIFVLDLKLVKWEGPAEHGEAPEEEVRGDQETGGKGSAAPGAPPEGGRMPPRPEAPRPLPNEVKRDRATAP